MPGGGCGGGGQSGIAVRGRQCSVGHGERGTKNMFMGRVPEIKRKIN